MRVQQVHGVSFKKRAPRAIKEIRSFAEKAMVGAHHLFLQSPLPMLLVRGTCC